MAKPKQGRWQRPLFTCPRICTQMEPWSILLLSKRWHSQCFLLQKNLHHRFWKVVQQNIHSAVTSQRNSKFGLNWSKHSLLLTAALDIRIILLSSCTSPCPFTWQIFHKLLSSRPSNGVRVQHNLINYAVECQWKIDAPEQKEKLGKTM